MKRTKTQKGITLIALIITIVVLMVLAAVAISSIQNDGIIGHAQNATNKFTEEQQKEQDMLEYYELILSGKAWTQNGKTVSRGTDTFKVGQEVKLKVGTADPVAYSDSIASGAEGDYTGKWVVLGVENGKLLLVSASNVVSSVALGGVRAGAGTVGGLFDGVAALDTMCAAYLNTTFADSARSITVEDINRVTGYVPSAGTTYTITEGSYSTEYGDLFYHPDGRIIGRNGVESITETNTYYSYSGYTFIKDSNDPAYKALFSNTARESGGYWLASDYVDVSTHYEFDIWFVGYGFLSVYDQMIDKDGDFHRSYVEPFTGVSASFGVRAVVRLNSDVIVSEA